MRSLALITPGPLWTDGRPIFAQDATILSGHLDAMRRLFDGGELLLGGPAKDGRSGFALFDTATVDTSIQRMNLDPAVTSGLFRFAMHEIVPYFDAFDGSRHSAVKG
jgi:uncharacterized protein YciI